MRTRQTLERALKFVTDKYSNDGIYEYTCEQMKSLRQDLVVQRINDEFTVQGMYGDDGDGDVSSVRNTRENRDRTLRY